MQVTWLTLATAYGTTVVSSWTTLFPTAPYGPLRPHTAPYGLLRPPTAPNDLTFAPGQLHLFGPRKKQLVSELYAADVEVKQAVT
jgi:hypothetical protein